MKSNYLFLVLMCVGCSETFVVKGEGGETSMDTGGSGGIDNSGGTVSSGGIIETGGAGSGGFVNTGGASMDTGGSGGTGTECDRRHTCTLYNMGSEPQELEYACYPGSEYYLICSNTGLDLFPSPLPVGSISGLCAKKDGSSTNYCCAKDYTGFPDNTLQDHLNSTDPSAPNDQETFGEKKDVCLVINN